jgi:hypothetical protein
MRTTLDIDDDVLFAAKEIAKREKKTIGQVVSEQARRAFHMPAHPIQATEPAPKTEVPFEKYGLIPLPHRGVIITNAMVDRIRDEEGI